MHSNILKINPSVPSPEIIETAREITRTGGVIIFPTWCLYGLGADPFNPAAVSKIFHLKNRPPDKPILLLVKNRGMLEDLVQEIPETAQRLMDRFWPGKITLVFRAQKHIPETLTAGTGKIGIRIPLHPVAASLVKQLDIPITGTSANMSGTSGCSDIKEMPENIIKNSDLVLDAGPLKGGVGSTVIDVTPVRPEILREGEISKTEIIDFLGCKQTF